MTACEAPVPLGELVDWWLGDIVPERGDAIEEHFFGCEHCTARLERLQRLGTGVVALTRQGALPLTVTSELLNRLARDHRQVRHYTARPGQTVHCSSSPEDDWLMGRLVADVHDVERVDIDVEDHDGAPIAQIEDIAVDRQAGEVLVLYPAALGLDPAGMYMTIRLRDGDRVLGTYVFDHTPPDPI
jgi:hypothetical protein